MSTNYVSNKELLEEIIEYKKTCKYDENGKYVKGSGRMNNNLGRMMLLIANGLATKPNFIGYTWREDMVAEGLLAVCKYLHNFDPEKSTNAFSYITQYFYNAFIAYINKQKKHSYIKDQLFTRQDCITCDTEIIDYEQFKDVIIVPEDILEVEETCEKIDEF